MSKDNLRVNKMQANICEISKEIHVTQMKPNNS